MSQWQVEAMEHFMLVDDRPDRPMTFFLRAEVTGSIDPDTFRRAVEDAARRHPLMMSRVVGPRNGARATLSWQFKGDSVPGVFFDVDSVTPLDPWTEAPMRCFVRSRKGDATILLQLHHAATDATGAIHVLEDILANYGESKRAATATRRPIDSALLDGRGGFHLSRRDRWLRWPRDLQRIARFFRTMPPELATTPHRPGPFPFSPEQYPATARFALSSQELAALRSFAKGNGATINDVMLARLFRTIEVWNRRSGQGTRSVRLAMAINMRRKTDSAMPAANVVSMCFLDRTSGQITRPSLLPSVVAETTSIKTHYLGYALLFITELLGRIRGGIQFLMASPLLPKCQSTAVLSNLGMPFADSPLSRDEHGRLHVEGLTLTAVELLPPVRDGTKVAIGVVTYADTMYVTLHYDHTALSAVDAENLAHDYALSLRY